MEEMMRSNLATLIEKIKYLRQLLNKRRQRGPKNDSGLSIVPIRPEATSFSGSSMHNNTTIDIRRSNQGATDPSKASESNIVVERRRRKIKRPRFRDDNEN